MNSEFQKQEALQSLEVAKRALQEKKIEKATRFAHKAQKLCNCPEVAEFLTELSSFKARPSSSTSASPNLRQRPQAAPKKDQGTPEQRALIAKIKTAKDFYETLDLTKDASEEDIKKSYRKLALKLHPDKNKAPGAEEAFKAVSRAASCLTDEEKRRTYDTYGTEDNIQSAGHSHNRYHQEFFQDDFDPEEIFRMFFGGQFPMNGRRVYQTNFYGPTHRRHTSANGHGDNGATSGQQEGLETLGLKTLIRFLPLILFFAFTFFSSSPAPIYSMYPDYNFRDTIQSQNYRVPYYVKSRAHFERTYPLGTATRQQIEDQVEETFRSLLQAQCREEKLKRRRLETWKGKEAAEKYSLSSCIKLHDVFGSSNRRRTTATVH